MTSLYEIGKVWCGRCGKWQRKNDTCFDKGNNKVCPDCGQRVRLRARQRYGQRLLKQPSNWPKKGVQWNNPLIHTLAKASEMTGVGLRMRIVDLAKAIGYELPMASHFFMSSIVEKNLKK